MKIQRTNHDDLNISLNVTIEQSDYSPKYDSEVRKYQKQAQFKGFRKGKTPISFVKKMYGQSILAEAVNETLQSTLMNYIKDEELSVLGDPLPAESQKQLELDPNNLEDYSFEFDLGLSPALEIAGADEKDSYNIFNIEVGDAAVDEELTVARKRQGSQVEMDKDIKDKDILTIEAKELDGKKVKKDGWETGFSVMVDLIGDEKVQKDVLTKKKGDSIDFDIYNIEKDKDEAHVKKYFLNLDENEEKEIGRMFRGKIAKVQRLKEADLDQAFFDGYFGPDLVKSEDEARAKIKEGIGKYYETQAKSYMYREMLETLVDTNDFPLPDAFLKRWLKTTNDKVTDEDLEKEFPDFVKNLKWTLIRGELAKREEVKVDPEEIQQSIAAQVRQYFGPYGMDNAYIDQTIQKMMADREQVNKVYEELLSQKVFVSLEKKVTLVEQNIGLEEFKDKVKETNERLNAR